MREWTPTPFGDKEKGRWPRLIDVPNGVVLQCRRPNGGYYTAHAATIEAIPMHRHIVGWAAVPEYFEAEG